jgi:hypothetical protein
VQATLGNKLAKHVESNNKDMVATPALHHVVLLLLLLLLLSLT